MTNRQKKRIAIITLLVLGTIGLSILVLALIPVNDYVYSSGYFTTPLRSEVHALAQQAVAKVMVEDGDRVEKDQLLVQLQDDDLQLVIEERKLDKLLAEAELQQQLVENKEADLKHQQALAEIKLQLDGAQRAYERAQQLAETEAISSEEVERLKLERDLAQQRYNAEAAISDAVPEAKAELLRRKIDLVDQQLKQAEALLEKRKIRAPIAGVLDLSTLAVGEIIDPARVVGEVFDDSSFVIRAKVPERYLHKIKIGQEASAALMGYPHDDFGYFPGKIKSVKPILIPLKAGEGYVLVEVTPDKPQNESVKYRVGMFADIRVLAGRTNLLDKLINLN